MRAHVKGAEIIEAVQEKELKILQKKFRSETRDAGVIEKSEFRKALRGYNLSSRFIQEMLFNAFDVDGDGRVSFHDFVTALSVITRGTPDERLRCM
jgi:Ca2+-binding EF-hand superfamily protein